MKLSVKAVSDASGHLFDPGLRTAFALQGVVCSPPRRAGLAPRKSAEKVALDRLTANTHPARCVFGTQGRLPQALQMNDGLKAEQGVLVQRLEAMQLLSSQYQVSLANLNADHKSRLAEFEAAGIQNEQRYRGMERQMLQQIDASRGGQCIEGTVDCLEFAEGCDD